MTDHDDRQIAPIAELSDEEMALVSGGSSIRGSTGHFTQMVWANTRCTGDACNGGNAGLLFGDGGNGL